jgi:Ca2+:H+ antiporter
MIWTRTATVVRRLGPRWSVLVPVLAVLLLGATWGRHPGAPVLAVVGVFLMAAVVAAVHHAEVVAHKVGEPFGSLVLAVAVTVIEVALIVTLMVSGGGAPRLWPGTRSSPR